MTRSLAFPTCCAWLALPLVFAAAGPVSVEAIPSTRDPLYLSAPDLDEVDRTSRIPINPTTRIRFDLATAGLVRLHVLLQ